MRVDLEVLKSNFAPVVNRGPSSGADPGSAKDHSHSTLVDSVAFNKARKLRHRKITIRTKRMARGFLNCTQVRCIKYDALTVSQLGAHEQILLVS